MTERRTSPRADHRRRPPRREVLCADLDRLSDAYLVWHAPFDDAPFDDALSDDAPRAGTTATSPATAGSDAAPPDASTRGTRLCDALTAALATALTARQREVVELHFYEGLSQGEIARRLGITQQVVQKCLYGAPRGGRLIGGALARLRAALAPLLVAEASASLPLVAHRAAPTP